MQRKIVCALILLLFFAACKYEDGPLISPTSKFHRLSHNKEWTLENLKIDGIDKTQLYIDSCGCNLRFEKFKVHHSADENYIHLTKCISSNSFMYGFWNFNDHKNILYIYTGYTSGPNIKLPFLVIGPIGPQRSSFWKISKLTSNEFWFSTNYNNEDYFFKFKKI